MRWPVALSLPLLAATSIASAQEIRTPFHDIGAALASEQDASALLASLPARQQRGNLRLHALDRPTNGLLIGAALGASAGILLGALACHQDVGSRGCTGVALRIGILGLGLGGAFGALIGSAGSSREPSQVSASRAVVRPPERR
jgi:hypothetical protein